VFPTGVGMNRFQSMPVRVGLPVPHLGGVKKMAPLLLLKDEKQKQILVAFYEKITGRNSEGKMIE
jgi:hypothetical protein